MTKQELERELKKKGAFVSIADISRITGIYRGTLRDKYLVRLQHIKMGRYKRYFYRDVANAIYEAMGEEDVKTEIQERRQGVAASED